MKKIILLIAAMNRLRYIIYVLFATLLLSSCKNPDDNVVDPTIVNLKLDLSLDLASISNFEDYNGIKTISKSNEAIQYNVRTIIEIYEADNSSKVIERTIKYYSYLDVDKYKVNETYSLNAKKYRILVWADVIDNAENEDLYYTSTDLRNILPTTPYTGASDLKHCFSDVVDVDLTPYRDEWNVSHEVKGILERPLSRFEIISTDLDKFISEQVQSRDNYTKADIDLSKYTIKLHYDGYMPYGYNVESDLPNRAETGVEFTSKLESISETNARLSFDHVFVNHSESSVNVSMMLYDEDGELIKQTNSIKIPLKRNQKTSIEGNFLTKEYAPGFAIDPSFEGDINIWID